jgi:outer membrane protein assembly factor BamB
MRIILSFSLLIVLSCSQKKTEMVWKASLPGIGSQSSPRTADLNGDGILDIVMGAGANEYQESAFGVIALDGKTGELLWKHACKDQVYGSAVFLDVNADGVQDVFIGGRGNQFYAINGSTGESLWQWNYEYEDDPVLTYARFNFQNAVLIPDQNEDKLNDLLVICSGNPKAEPATMENRFPGVLMILNPVNGNVIAADTMPDGREAYMPPLYFEQPDGSQKIVFGTGGETIDGTLYLCDLKDLLQRNLRNSRPLTSEKGHGYIAPSTAVDINGDGYKDVVSISHGSTITASDGKTLKTIWTLNIPETESSNALSVGQFTGDETPDFFTFVSRGVWPASKGSVQILIDGKTGKKVYSNALGCTGFSSPVIYDLNDDGTDEAILSINEYDCDQGFVSEAKLDISTRLIALDFKNNQVQTIEQQSRFKNIFSTPWIGDLDGDAYLDIIYASYFSPNSSLLAFMGLEMKRISTSIKAKKAPKWGAYMGSEGNGVWTE